MTQRGVYGRQLGDAFKVGSAPAFVSRRTIHGGEIGVTRLRCDAADNTLTSPCVEEGAFMMMLQLRDWPQRNLWADDKPVRAEPLKAGAVSIFDLSRTWVGHRVCPIHQMNFYLPQSAIDSICAAEHASPVRKFDNDPLTGAEDEVVHRLGLSLLRAFEAPDEVNRLFIEHVTSAAAVHAVRRYGVASSSILRSEVELSAAQRASVLELLDSRLDGELSTVELAQACGLPLTAFVAAFERSMGMLPHRWLLERRVERAMVLTRSRLRHQGDLARECGFANHRHLERVFEQIVGIPLASWRSIVFH